MPFTSQKYAKEYVKTHREQFRRNGLNYYNRHKDAIKRKNHLIRITQGKDIRLATLIKYDIDPDTIPEKQIKR